MNLQDVFWSLDKTIRGKTLRKDGIIDFNIPIHEIKGYYQGVDNQNRPVYFEVYMKSVASDSKNKDKLFYSNQMRENNLSKNNQNHAHRQQSTSPNPYTVNESENPPQSAPIREIPALPYKKDAPVNPLLMSNGDKSGRPAVKREVEPDDNEL